MYLGTSPEYDFLTYRQVVHNCTEEFSRISKRVIAIEEQFQGAHHNDEIAKLIRKLQENEQTKLQLVRKHLSEGKI